MKRYQATDAAVVTDMELALKDLQGAISPAGYPRFYVRKPSLVTVTVKVGAETFVAFSDTITPGDGKVTPFEPRIRIHPDIAAETVPPDPALVAAEAARLAAFEG